MIRVLLILLFLSLSQVAYSDCSCNTFTSSGTCGAQAGCTWAFTGMCGGGDLTDEGFCTYNGCCEVTGTEFCDGLTEDPPCSAMLTSVDCANDGCTWHFQQCSQNTESSSCNQCTGTYSCARRRTWVQ